METIIYFYRSRENSNFITEKWREDDYCLIRAGVPPFIWRASAVAEEQSDSMYGNARQTEKIPLDEKQQQDNRIRIWRRFSKVFSRHSRQSEVVADAVYTRRHVKSREQSGRGKRVEWEMRVKDWQTALRLLSDHPNQIACVYEDSLRRELEREDIRNLWCAHWNIPEFENFHEWKWVERLMEHVVHDRYVIVGDAPCVPELLYKYSRRMRSVRWLLLEQQYTEDVQDFMDDFYEETGLAIETELVLAENDMHPWVRMHLTAPYPVNIIDFSGEEKLSACGVPRGSIWLDMDSLEGKCERVEVRNPDIFYFSLKKEWKQRKSPYLQAKSVGLP